MTSETTKMLPALDNYDWAEVFGEGGGGNCTRIIPNRVPGFTGSAETFGRVDVATIAGMVLGENDGPDWVVYGKLKDGRWFVARAGCDYTGWDCRASNSGDVAATKSAIERLGLSSEEKIRLGVAR